MSCQGNPDIGTTNLQGLITKFCNNCLEVIDYNKEGNLIVVTERKVEAPTDRHGDSFSDPLKETSKATIVNSNFIPGNIIQFKDLVE
jgi:hypothetical protein